MGAGLVLHIEVEGFNAEGLDEYAAILAEPEQPGAEHRLKVVTEEWIREEVGLTLVSLPDEKSMNDDFGVHAFNGRIVGAHLRRLQDTRIKEEGGYDPGGLAENYGHDPD